MLWIGIDAHKRIHQAVALSVDGVLAQKVIANQQRSYPPAQAYMARRQHEGRTPREARRALKRHLVRRIWHQWQACWPATT